MAVAASARDGGGSGFPQLAGMAWSQDCSHGSCVQAVPCLLDPSAALYSATQEFWEL